ncbi:hypothetical protein BGS_0648 [Beggiatoa sp. SS]|nr:hypothetical protein BGS_0648 [Beggiatoa sp. SS]
MGIADMALAPGRENTPPLIKAVILNQKGLILSPRVDLAGLFRANAKSQ